MQGSSRLKTLLERQVTPAQQVGMEGEDFPLKAATFVLILLVLGGFIASCEETWCYDHPSCGPDTWASIGFCNGKRQSPIYIDTNKATFDASLGPISFTGYEDRRKPRVIKNNGQTVVVEINSGATISSAGLPGIYHLKFFHLHWGTEYRNCAEHTINDKRYSMELHLVHTKNNLTLEEADKDPEGYVVLAFFIQNSGKAGQVNSWHTLANFLPKIPEKGDSQDLNGEFCMGGLLNVADVSRYYQYRGSFTTPNCNESVIWTIFPDPIEVSDVVIKKFTNSLYFTTKKENRRMQNNCRPLQPLNQRRVLYYRENAFLYSCLKRCFDQMD